MSPPKPKILAPLQSEIGLLPKYIASRSTNIILEELQSENYFEVKDADTGEIVFTIQGREGNHDSYKEVRNSKGEPLFTVQRERYCAGANTWTKWNPARTRYAVVDAQGNSFMDVAWKWTSKFAHATLSSTRKQENKSQ